MQIRMNSTPRPERPSPIIMRRRLSYLSARTPAGAVRRRQGTNPKNVRSAMSAALPVFWKIYNPRPKLVRPPPIDDMNSPAQSRRNLP